MAGNDGLFARTGKDSIDLAGHKIPIALIGGVAALLTVVLVLRARSRGSNVASVGAQPGSPYTAASTGFGTGAVSPDYGPALANLSQQLTNLGQQSLAAPSPPQLQILTGNADFRPGAGWGGQPGLLPLYGQRGKPGSGDITWVPTSTALEVVGPTGAFGTPVDYLGTQFFVEPSQWALSQSPTHPASYRPLT